MPAVNGVPEGWAMVSLSAAVAPSKEKTDPAKVADQPYIGLEHIEAHTTRLLGHGTAHDVRSTKAVFRMGDVLYGKLRPYLGKVCIAPFDGVASTDILVFPKTPPIDSRYLVRFLSQPHVSEFASHRSSGTQLPRISFSALGELPFPLPPLAEQERIVDLLEQLLAKLDSCRDRMERVPGILGRFRQTVLAAACSGRLTEEWRQRTGSNHTPPAEVVPGLVDQFDLPDIPESWSWARMGDVSDIRGGIQKQPKRTPRRNAFPFLRVANVRRGGLDLDEIARMELFDGELDTYRLQPGDLLIVEGNGSLTEIGRSAVWGGEIQDCVHQNHIIRVRPRLASSRFLDYYWNSSLGRRHVAMSAVTSSGLYSLSTGKIAGLPVPLPPRGEQEEIVRRVDELLSLESSIQRSVRGAAKRSERTVQAVFSRAFRGELVPTEAELAAAEGRSYEPAEELLERVASLRGRSKASGDHSSRGRPKGVLRTIRTTRK